MTELSDDECVVDVREVQGRVCCGVFSSMSEGKIVDCFIKLISYYHPLTCQLHRAAGEAGVCAAVHEGWQYDNVEAVELCVAAVVVMAAETCLDGG